MFVPGHTPSRIIVRTEKNKADHYRSSAPRNQQRTDGQTEQPTEGLFDKVASILFHKNMLSENEAQRS